VVYQVKVGKVYGNKKVLSLAGSRGKFKYYKVKCLKCGWVCIMYQDSVGRRTQCDRCRRKVLREKYNYGSIHYAVVHYDKNGDR
jgi:ribosomal protein S27E